MLHKHGPSQMPELSGAHHRQGDEGHGRTMACNLLRLQGKPILMKNEGQFSMGMLKAKLAPITIHT